MDNSSPDGSMSHRWAPLVFTACLVLVSPLQGQEPDSTTMNLFDYDIRASLDVDTAGVREGEGFRVHDITYASPKGGRVPAYLYVPTTPGPHAGIIMMHGMPGSRASGTGWAAILAVSGAVVLAPNAPWARPDGPRDRVLTFTEQDREEQIQLMVDLRRGVDLLIEQPTVPPRIG